MREVTIKGKVFYYFTKDEKIPPKLEMDGVIRHLDWYESSYPDAMYQYVLTAPDVRAVVTCDKRHVDSAYVFYVCWLDKINLDDLDSKARRGKALEAWFENTIILQYASAGDFTGCGNHWHILARPISSFVTENGFSNSEPPSKRLKRLRCPECGVPFKEIDAVRIIAKAGVRETWKLPEVDYSDRFKELIASQRIAIYIEQVPVELHPLIPFAEKFCQLVPVVLERALLAEDTDTLKRLVEYVAPFREKFEVWDKPVTAYDYTTDVFSYLLVVAEMAAYILRERNNRAP